MSRKGIKNGEIGPRVTVVCEVCGATRELWPSQVKHGEGRFCSRACKNEGQRYRFDRNAETKRFWSKVDRSGGPDACWPFGGNDFRRGYGQARWKGKPATAARVAYEIAHGRPLEHDACHTCDNPPCCNPAHIFDGTPKQNRDDCAAKMRHNYGERNGGAKLTEDQVREIRQLATRGSAHSSIAIAFGVSRRQVSDIVGGKKWKHLLTA